MFTHVEKFNFPNLKRETYEGKRVYKTENGDRYPSVTTVLGTRQNLTLRFGGNESVLKLLIRLVDKLSVRGTKIHGLCEDYINNDELNTEKITFVEEIIFNNMKTYINRIDNIHCVEQFLFSEHLRLNGQVDCIAEFDGRLSVIDFKTSAKLKKKSNIKNYFAQCAAYAIMFEERTGVFLLTPLLLLLVLMGKTRNFLSKNVIITQNIC